MQFSCVYSPHIPVCIILKNYVSNWRNWKEICYTAPVIIENSWICKLLKARFIVGLPTCVSVIVTFDNFSFELLEPNRFCYYCCFINRQPRIIQNILQESKIFNVVENIYLFVCWELKEIPCLWFLYLKYSKCKQITP